MTHSLVPPTPGPTAVASLLNVDLFAMILGGQHRDDGHHCSNELIA